MTRALSVLRSEVLRVTLRIVYFILVAVNGLQRIGDRVRAVTLIVGLSTVYILIITPMALSKRNNAKRRLSSWMDNSESGWQANVQSTKDDAIFNNSRSPSDELAQLREGYDNSALVVYNILKPLRWLAKPPEEKELSADLYVMF